MVTSDILKLVLKKFTSVETRDKVVDGITIKVNPMYEGLCRVLNELVDEDVIEPTDYYRVKKMLFKDQGISTWEGGRYFYPAYHHDIRVKYLKEVIRKVENREEYLKSKGIEYDKITHF
jgi:hypothetical protein